MKLLITLALLTFTQTVWSQSPAVRIKHFNIKKSVAIEGFDPVSYFSGKPQEGKEDLIYTYNGITYQFASQANLSKFKSTPEKYEPAYGGWCAYAMGETGEKVKIDPETYKIVEGKLYLFYNFWGNNTLTSWNKEEIRLKTNADLNWRRFVQ
jgi:YHS domain-containing protein